MPHPHPIPSSRQFPDPHHFHNLERLGQEITQLAAHIHTATFQLLELIRGNAFSIQVANRNQGLDITPETLPPHWLGEEMDYSLAVTVLQSSDNVCDLP